MNTIVKEVMDNLERKKIKTRYFETKNQVMEQILQETKNVTEIGIGGSMTIKEMNLHEALEKDGKNIHWHWLVEPEEREEVRQQAAKAEIYLTSTNALTEAGELINIDGVGNRVSAMYYGPKKVIVVCGINKICSDLITAMDRIKKQACPPNAKRLGLKTPCAATGACNDCLSEERMCNVTVIINHKPMAVDLNVYIVGEELGY
ncbi:MAG: lactate utilization protein [Clostridiaceae bacterium]|nr:lactate utilization protein [Clostridiaceae bacterium]